jgi:3-deoxy-D-manno-octulosonic-acid transferase
MGPHTFNFAEAAELALAAQAAWRVADVQQGVALAAQVAGDSAAQGAAAAHALAFAQAHRGATERMAERIDHLWQAQAGAEARGHAASC